MNRQALLRRLVGAMPAALERQQVTSPASAPGVVIDPETFELVQTLLDRELRSRDTLRSNLTALLAFTGAVLAFSVGAETTLLSHGLGSVGQPFFFGLLMLAQVLLVLTILRAVRSLDTRPRARLKTKVLMELGYETRDVAEIRGLAYRTSAATLHDVTVDNDVLGGQVRAVVDALRAALVVAAIAAAIVGARGIGLWKTRTHPSRQATTAGAVAKTKAVRTTLALSLKAR